ncbi:hypothetical protein DCS_01920 [Drechmeria coniospora]|uniref:Carbohydrate-binding domain-containing protein n=1 Tax=Drechmeria coniospora TaxID=98403 RepID=A0A151GUT5_DRECN|nr:hypothetical protein DCS_01920 [Drechmeria coniospora]KYK60782.1 hypothetical protein DCS_01920 [Drechmeria coniospora]ODA83476.1 hypothetical protein RJ55_01990 [Drechmeria coniospora]
MPSMGPLLPVFALAAGVVVSCVAAAGVPHVDIPSCSRGKGFLEYSKSVPERTAFPRTQVGLCYSDLYLHINFVAHDEVNFYFNSSQGTNDDIWKYEVMEAFIQKGKDDPKSYLEFEVNPDNVTYQAFIFNPSKNRADGAPFEHAFIKDPAAIGIQSTTILDRDGRLWMSNVQIPLGLFGVYRDKAKGTLWRMNFFRTVVDPKTYPQQELGAWSPPDKANFHITPFFGIARFV